MAKSEQITLEIAIDEAKRKIREALNRLETEADSRIKMASLAINLAEVAALTGLRLKPQVCITTLREMNMTNKKIADAITEKGIHCEQTTVSRALHAKKQTMSPKRVDTLEKVWYEHYVKGMK